jgi:dTDP-glucose 4,6-dehydratase
VTPIRIVVTGGLGFIGSNFIRSLLSRRGECHVTNLDKLGMGSNPVNLKDLEEDVRYTFFKGSTTDQELVNDLIQDADVVVNFAAETHVDRSIANPLAFFESNTEGTIHLLEAMRQCHSDSRLIHVSTDEVYGDVPEGSCKEDAMLNPSSPYAASKAASDMAVISYQRTYGLDSVISRCTNNFGPYQFPEKLLPKTIIRAYLNLRIPVYGSGQNVRDWIHVEDHCSALETLLEGGRSGQVFNISADSQCTNLELVNKVLTLMEKSDLVEFVRDRPGHDVRYSLDSSRIREKLGWQPRRGLEEALEDTVQWYAQNEEWWRPLATDEVLHPAPWELGW